MNDFLPKGILSVQSHVAYGYVGNKAAVFPLELMGFDVWPVHTVQFSNHTGYGAWQGDVFSASHVKKVIEGVLSRIQPGECQALLSGYLGDVALGEVVHFAYEALLEKNPSMIYLCDPVMGDRDRGVFVKTPIVDFFKENLKAHIITPNHFEAEILAGFPILNLKDAKKACHIFHQKNISVVVITSLQIKETQKDQLGVLVSFENQTYFMQTLQYHFDYPLNGTGDLFSSLFLGFYLKEPDCIKALEKSVFIMDDVIKNTQLKKRRELDLLGIKKHFFLAM